MSIFPGKPTQQGTEHGTEQGTELNKELNMYVTYQGLATWSSDSESPEQCVAHTSSPYRLWQERPNVSGNGVSLLLSKQGEITGYIPLSVSYTDFHSNHVLALPTHPT